MWYGTNNIPCDIFGHIPTFILNVENIWEYTHNIVMDMNNVMQIFGMIYEGQGPGPQLE